MIISLIAGSDERCPRNDSASVLELKDGRLMVVWQKYSNSSKKGSDYGLARISSKISSDKGLTWGEERILVDVEPDDLNVQAPALCRTLSGNILLMCLRAHSSKSTSMVLFKSQDEGRTFEKCNPIWEHSKGQWLQGGANSLVQLKCGRIIFGCHGGTGHQINQHNVVYTYYSDDDGETWNKNASKIDLPMRGAMEASIAELANETLIMSIRTQLGSVFISYSKNHGEMWTLPQSSSLQSPESCTCIRRIPGTDDLVLFWNNSLYNPTHHHFGLRTPLSSAISNDGGETWKNRRNIETGDFIFTNLGCTFISSGKAVLTYSKICDPSCVNGIYKLELNWLNEGYDLYAAIIDIDWLYENKLAKVQTMRNFI